LENILYLFALIRQPRDLGLLVAAGVGCWLLSLFIYWVFYGLCALAAGLSIRLAYTYGIIVFAIGVLFVFPDLKEYFVWWRYSPGPTSGVIGDFILLMSVVILHLILMWAIWPRPRKIDTAW
jgi:hypothetical protein